MRTNIKNFIAIDFETANHQRTSACQIGIVVVRDSIIIEEFVSYIQPVPFYFRDDFIDIHGITPETVKNAPFFSMVWNNIKEIITNSEIIVAHNAPFDMGVLKECLSYYGINSKLPPSFCTVKLARKKLPELENHRLSTVCRHLGISLNHHEALSDAKGCAEILLRLDGVLFKDD